MKFKIKDLFFVLKGSSGNLVLADEQEEVFLDFDEAVYECERLNDLLKQENGNEKKQYPYVRFEIVSLKQAVENTIEIVREDSFENGFEKGQSEGRELGWDDGYDSGYNEGMEQGRREAESEYSNSER